jgi:hypothetical protein
MEVAVRGRWLLVLRAVRKPAQAPGSSMRSATISSVRRAEMARRCSSSDISSSRGRSLTPTPKASALTYASQLSGVRRPSRSSQRPFIIALIETSCAASKPWRNATVRSKLMRPVHIPMRGSTVWQTHCQSLVEGWKALVTLPSVRTHNCRRRRPGTGCRSRPMSHIRWHRTPMPKPCARRCLVCSSTVP